MKFLIKVVMLTFLIAVIVSGCREIEGLPEDVVIIEEGTEPVGEEPAQDVEEEAPVLVEKPIEPIVLKLDLSKAKDFDLSTDDIGNLHAHIVYRPIEEAEMLESIFTDERLEALRDHLSKVKYNVELNQIGIVSDPTSIYVLCNKLNKLPEDYEPSMLFVPDVRFSFGYMDMKKHLRPVASNALKEMFDSALEDEVNLVAVSGYRSFSRQRDVYGYKAANRGVEEADKVSARPGHSEHQTGLTMDVSSSEIGYGLEESFALTKEGLWLVDHAHEFGFIIRYPQEDVEITGYAYEPWHIRYVGVEVASYVYDYKVTLEELYTSLLTHNQ